MKRFFQDERFQVLHLNGATIDACLGVCADADDLTPALVLLKPHGLAWQRFHLDQLGFGVWEEVPEQVVQDDLGDDSYAVADYAARFGLREARILDTRCAPNDAGRLQLWHELSVGVLVLSQLDNDTSQLSFVSSAS